MRTVYLLFFFIAAWYSSSGQHCLIVYSNNTQEELKKARVESIEVFSGNQKKPEQRFRINRHGCVERYQYFDFLTDDGIISQREQINDTTVVYTESKAIGDSIRLLENTRAVYTTSGKLLKTIGSEYGDFIEVTVVKYDTADHNNFEKTELSILQTDTIQQVYHSKGPLEEIRSVSKKIEGRWREIERSVALYKNGKLDSYKLYKNGKPVHQYDASRDLMMNPLGHPDENLETPLPFTTSPRQDTLFVSDLTTLKVISPADAPYMLVKYYPSETGKDAEYSNIYFTRNKLLYRRIMHDNPELSETFRYTFYR